MLRSRLCGASQQRSGSICGTAICTWHGEKLLLLLDGKYPVIIDLHEDGVQELIPAAVMDELPFLKAVHITRDGKYLLLNAGRYYCAAIGTEPLTCLDELCGAALTGVQLHR